ncbi:MAG: hypothetical protein K0Q72_3100 [Armatimonadetes bacterium]|jgi:hypothetical protein|nr:hypothetical protein [Armatimonadota bacterium]
MELFGWFMLLFAIFFVAIVGALFFQIIRGIGQWAHNNGQPVLTEQARVVSKRTETGGSVSSNTGGRVYTTYFVTFQFPSGERREFSMAGRDSGTLVEGDEGELTYQGTRFKGFKRELAAAPIPTDRRLAA